MSTRPFFRLLLLALLAASGLSLGHAKSEATRPDWLETYGPEKISSRAVAEQALREIDTTKPRVMRNFLIQERACFDKFFVNACVASVEQTRKDYERRYNDIEVQARQVIRNDEAFLKSEALAKAQSERQEEAPGRQAQQLAAQQREQERTRQAEERITDRERQLLAQDGKEASLLAKRESMQADLAKRNQQATERTQLAEGNALARAAREAEHNKRVEQRKLQVAEQREKAMRKQIQREEEVRKQAQRRAEVEAKKAARAESAPAQRQ